MLNVDLVALLAIQVLYAIASLALISVGLAIIFGMMRVINLAHGEFLMLGGYAAIVATSHGINIWIAMLVVAPVVVGIIGVIVERTIIRFLYGRMIDTMLRDLGPQSFSGGLTTAIFGNHFGLGKVYLPTSKRDQARDHLTAATTMYREMDMPFWLEQAEAEMRQL
jgi:branched-chain amino acid transport system permease protein